jgi:hypothetical protein
MKKNLWISLDILISPWIYEIFQCTDCLPFTPRGHGHLSQPGSFQADSAIFLPRIAIFDQEDVSRMHGSMTMG